MVQLLIQRNTTGQGICLLHTPLILSHTQDLQLILLFHHNLPPLSKSNYSETCPRVSLAKGLTCTMVWIFPGTKPVLCLQGYNLSVYLGYRLFIGIYPFRGTKQSNWSKNFVILRLQHKERCQDLSYPMYSAAMSIVLSCLSFMLPLSAAETVFQWEICALLSMPTLENRFKPHNISKKGF